MKIPSFADSFEVLCLQAGHNGRAEVLFGTSFKRAIPTLRPFIVGKTFPSVYLEFPLKGEPFLDITVLYDQLEPHTSIDSPAAAGTEPMLDWFAGVGEQYENVSCGFELDTKNEQLSAAGVHFQPRRSIELVEPFCQAIGEPERAALYLNQAERMPPGWSLSFFGLFRGRPGSPLRVCGYLGNDERDTCAEDPRHLAAVFDEIGFTAYDDAMLDQAAALMTAAPGGLDFQFDVYPNGKLGDVFALDIQFEIKQPESVMASFENGDAARIMKLIESIGAADERWKLSAEAAFARALPVETADGNLARFAFTLMPQWVKVRWRDRALQNSKLYYLGTTTLFDDAQ